MKRKALVSLNRPLVAGKDDALKDRLKDVLGVDEVVLLPEGVAGVQVFEVADEPAHAGHRGGKKGHGEDKT